MGAFNRFLTERRCPECGQLSEQAFQFKFGSKAQYDYRTGDVLRWGGNDEGDPGQPLVLVSCVPEACPACGLDYDCDDHTGYRLRVENDTVVSVSGPMALSDVVLGSNGDLISTMAMLDTKRDALGLWSTWVFWQTGTNSAECVWVRPTRELAELYGVSWKGPCLVAVMETTRANELPRLLADVPLVPLTANRGTKLVTRPGDIESFVEGRESDDVATYVSQSLRNTGQRSHRRVLIYENEGDLPIVMYMPDTDEIVKGPGWT